MRLSEQEQERWQAQRRALLEAAAAMGRAMRPRLEEIRRAASAFQAQILDATWPLRYEDDICEPEEDVFV